MDLTERLDDSLETAPGLPRSAYTGEAFASLERTRLFHKTWHAIGFAHFW